MLSERPIRVSECFVSVQGEGPHTGVPTTFLRMAGCNLRCSGWGVKTTLPNGEVVYGCDSPHSVWPEIFTQEGGARFFTPDELVEKIPPWPKNVCLTGGEPLLQKKALTPVVEGLLKNGHTIEIFTNGTYPLETDLKSVWLDERVTYVMDYKPKWSLPELPFVEDNLNRLREHDCVKFVCKNNGDFNEAVKVIDDHPDFRGTWYMGVVLGLLAPETLVQWMLDEYQENVVLNLQTQAYLGLMLEPSTKHDTFDEKERYLRKII